MSSANAPIARRLIEAYDARTLLDPITDDDPEFDTAAAYDVLHMIELDRLARGWLPVGRKIGFTNRTIWELYGVSGPMWARVWDRTLHVAGTGVASISLEPFVQPRIEPEVVFGLAAPIPAGDDAVELLSCVEWMAAGFEIVQCHFPGWRFAAPDSTASFGLHGALVVGVTGRRHRRESCVGRGDARVVRAHAVARRNGRRSRQRSQRARQPGPGARLSRPHRCGPTAVLGPGRR